MNCRRKLRRGEPAVSARTEPILLSQYAAKSLAENQAHNQDFNHGGLRRSQEGLHVVASAEGAKPLPTTGSGGASYFRAFEIKFGLFRPHISMIIHEVIVSYTVHKKNSEEPMGGGLTASPSFAAPLILCGDS